MGIEPEFKRGWLGNPQTIHGNSWEFHAFLPVTTPEGTWVVTLAIPSIGLREHVHETKVFYQIFHYEMRSITQHYAGFPWVF